ncbi:hypothetical protein [Burkholderia cepacia]|uniref:hypothetical protein n=1 Tax=Burkholderia cepacia TaxID=292 RepID=UPI000AF413E8|nr:hypothetical protein [Burkholderia cepacia]MBY4801912.1 hypothetical protein [Burkholderia cepacia]MCA7899764.1 hypothetical protein [Burkholderia cepacia]MCA8116521.1 hypothetical protein [Burkholderia cepacia]MCA8217488.1 hypothetical protein [Burkholderia cepacia]MCA8330941.1 hypothetical protein [Burkholderia cepacia]
MSTQTITATNKTTRGQAPLRWKTGFEPGVNADIPAVAFGVVCWERQVEPVDTSTARLRHARRHLDAIDSTVATDIRDGLVAIGRSFRGLPP